MLKTVNIGGLNFQRNILILATAGGLLQAAQQLIESEYPADERTEEGITALYNASARGFSDICILLIKASVSVNIRGHWGCALLAASREGHARVVLLLLDNNAIPI